MTEHTEARVPLDEQIEAVRSMANYIGHRDGQNSPTATALRAALATLESARWRPIRQRELCAVVPGG